MASDESVCVRVLQQVAGVDLPVGTVTTVTRTGFVNGLIASGVLGVLPVESCQG